MDKEKNPVLFVLFPKGNVYYDERGDSHLLGWSAPVERTAILLREIVEHNVLDNVDGDVFFIFDGKAFSFDDKDILDADEINYHSGVFFGAIREAIQISQNKGEDI